MLPWAPTCLSSGCLGGRPNGVLPVVLAGASEAGGAASDGCCTSLTDITFLAGLVGAAAADDADSCPEKVGVRLGATLGLLVEAVGTADTGVALRRIATVWLWRSFCRLRSRCSVSRDSCRLGTVRLAEDAVAAVAVDELMLLAGPTALTVYIRSTSAERR
jgi:hypothetical protein